MSYEVRQEIGLSVVGIAARTSNSSAHEIGALWKRFYREGIGEQIPGRLDGSIYSVYSEYESDFRGRYTLLIGCLVSADAPIPEGLSRQVVKAGNYAVFEATGELPESVVSTWASIWETPLDRLYVTDFERYTKEGTVTVHVGIR
jgi:predicted transcriptional regulator YdeE